MTSPSIHQVPDWDESALRGQRVRFLLLLCVVLGVVLTRWAMS